MSPWRFAYCGIQGQAAGRLCQISQARTYYRGLRLNKVKEEHIATKRLVFRGLDAYGGLMGNVRCLSSTIAFALDSILLWNFRGVGLTAQVWKS